MTKRNFIKKSMAAAASLCFVFPLERLKFKKKESKTLSNADYVNMALGHSFTQSEFKQSSIS